MPVEQPGESFLEWLSHQTDETKLYFRALQAEKEAAEAALLPRPDEHFYSWLNRQLPETKRWFEEEARRIPPDPYLRMDDEGFLTWLKRQNDPIKDYFVALTNPNPLEEAISDLAPPGEASDSARSIIVATLNAYGLHDLADWAWEQFLGGAVIDQILLEMVHQPAYIKRFPAMGYLAKEGRAISESEYIDYEQALSQVFADLPKGMYDSPEDIAAFLMADVSVAEVQDRLKTANAALYNAPDEVQAQLNVLYEAGVGEGQVLAYFLDPDKANVILKQEFAAATASGQGVISGYGALNKGQAQLVGDAGLTQTALNKGFTQLTNQSELTQGRLGAHTDDDFGNMSVRDQLSAAFLGNSEAQRILLEEAEVRTAVFKAGGQYTEDEPNKGFSGIGSEQQ